MGGPAMDERGVSDRGTAFRISTPRPGAQPEYPAFHVDTLGLLGARAIPDALAYALKWQLEFQAAAGNLYERKELADKLIKLWHFLKEWEEKSPRDADGALLVEDPLWVLAHAREKGEWVETSSGVTVFVTLSREEAPLPVWAPTLIPSEYPFDMGARYPSRPVAVEELPPFTDANIRLWLLTSLFADGIPKQPPPLPGPEVGADGIKAEGFSLYEVEDTFDPGEDEAEKAMEDAAKKIDRQKWTAARLGAFYGNTPTVNATIARLRTTTLGDIQRYTGVKFDSAYLDVPLIKFTEVILYHSVYSFALDRNGEPFDLRYSHEGKGMIDYPMLIDEPGETVRRDVPPLDGVYISVQRSGFGLFRLSDAGIDKVLFGTVGAFTAYGYGASAPSGVHKALQSYINNFQPYGFVAAITVPGAYDRREITLGRIRSRIPEFVEMVTPHVVKEMMARAKQKLEHWEDFALEIAHEVIKQIILDKVKTKIRDYLIKKIGKRIVPGINAAAALYELATGGEDRMRIRNIVTCMYMALKTDNAEDLCIAAKTCAKPVADEFEDMVMDALINHSKKAASKLARKSKSKSASKSDSESKEAEERKQPKTGDTEDPVANDNRSVEARPGETDASQPVRTVKPSDAADTKPAQVDQPKPVDVPARNDTARPATGAQDTKMAEKSADTPAAKSDAPPGKAKDKAPRPPNKREREAQERWEEQERQHQEKIRKKIEGLKEAEEERKKATGTGDPAATGDAGKNDTGAARKSRGTGNKGTGSSAGTGDTGAGSGNNAANPANTGTASGNSAANTSNTGTRPGRVVQKPAPPKRKPIDPNEERGTLEQPRRVPDGPAPDPETIKVKDPDRPEGTDDVRDKPNVRTGRASHEEVLRANAEKQGGAFPLDHDAHHNQQKAGGGDAGEAGRDALGASGVSVDDAANATPARGLPRDPRAPHESSSQHWGLHKPEQVEALRRELETVKGDPEATRDVLRKHGLDLWEGRDIEPPDFWLGPDPDPPKPKKPKGGK